MELDKRGAELLCGRSVPMQERKRRVNAEAQRLVALGATLTAPSPPTASTITALP